MGAFLSIPMTTLLAVPLLSSTTTSLNLLFFTLNWYILLLSHPPLTVEFWGLIVIRLLFFLLPALGFLAFDTAIPSVAIQIKARGKYGLPLFKGRNKLAKIVGVAVLNTLGGIAVMIGLETLFTKVLLTRSLLSVSKQLPLPWSAVQQVVFGLAARGGLQYVIHRFILHDRSSPVAKLHTQWQHSIPSPFALVAAYDHPIPYLLHHWVPLYIPAIIFRTHLLPFLAILSVASLEELMTYSGYSVLPSAILVKGMARRVDNHFISRGKGNFAAFGAVDWIAGTAIGNDIADDLTAEWDKHNMDEKVAKGADDAGDFMDSVSSKVRGATKRRSARNGSVS